MLHRARRQASCSIDSGKIARAEVLYDPAEDDRILPIRLVSRSPRSASCAQPRVFEVDGYG
jgi:hypothetical protein